MNTNVPPAREADGFGDTLTGAESSKGESFFQFELFLPDIENCRFAPGKSPKLKHSFITKLPRFSPLFFRLYLSIWINPRKPNPSVSPKRWSNSSQGTSSPRGNKMLFPGGSCPWGLLPALLMFPEEALTVDIFRGLNHTTQTISPSSASLRKNLEAIYP